MFSALFTYFSMKYEFELCCENNKDWSVFEEEPSNDSDNFTTL